MGLMASRVEGDGSTGGTFHSHLAEPLVVDMDSVVAFQWRDHQEGIAALAVGSLHHVADMAVQVMLQRIDGELFKALQVVVKSPQFQAQILSSLPSAADLQSTIELTGDFMPSMLPKI